VGEGRVTHRAITEGVRAENNYYFQLSASYIVLKTPTEGHIFSRVGII